MISSKKLKRVGVILLLTYTHWLAYDHGKSFPSHMKAAKETIETVGEKSATFTSGMLGK